MRKSTNLEEVMIGCLYRLSKEPMFIVLGEDVRKGVAFCLKYAKDPDALDALIAEED